MAEIKLISDTVILSGGDLGGEVAPGGDWEDGKEVIFLAPSGQRLAYLRSGRQALFFGVRDEVS